MKYKLILTDDDFIQLKKKIKEEYGLDHDNPIGEPDYVPSVVLYEMVVIGGYPTLVWGYVPRYIFNGSLYEDGWVWNRRST